MLNVLSHVKCGAPDLIQRNHRVGHSKDEVDVVLRHLLCDQSKRWVILWGQIQMVWSAHANVGGEMSLFILQETCMLKQSLIHHYFHNKTH